MAADGQMSAAGGAQRVSAWNLPNILTSVRILMVPFFAWALWAGGPWGGDSLVARWVALALAVFTLAASFGFHHYWSMPADKVMVNQLMFFKNLAIVGGLLAFWSFGPGRLSVDER